MIAFDPSQRCCTCVGRRVSERLDGELEPRAEPSLALHLATCPRCRRLAAELAALVGAIHRLSRRGVAQGARP